MYYMHFFLLFDLNVLDSIPISGQNPVLLVQTSPFGIDSRLHGVHTHLY